MKEKIIIIVLNGQCHEYWYNHLNQYFLCISWWFSKSFKTFHYAIQLKAFYLILLNYLFWKCLLKPFSEFPFQWLVDVSSVNPSLATGKMRQNLLFHSAFSMLLQNHMLRTSFMQFQDKNCRIRVSEAGYWKDFQISKLFQRSKLQLRFFHKKATKM